MTTSIDGFSGARGIRPVVVRVQDSNEQSSRGSTEKTEKPEPDLDARRVSEATRKVAEMFQSVRRNLEFREDPASGRMIVSVIDAESGELIRQIPPELMVRIAEHLEQMSGLLLGERA